MAIYHLSAKVISRGKGQSAIAAAAYRSGERLYDEQAAEPKAYRRSADRILFAGIMVPADAPAWASDRSQLWNEAERAEKRKDAQLAREIEVSLPFELTAQQREWLVKDFAREAFVRKGYGVDIAIHAPYETSDERNHHAHLMVTRRTLGPEGFAATKDWQFDPKQLAGWREQWAHLANRHLERHGHQARVDHRSLEAQGADREPTVHLGYAAREMSQRGAQSDRMDALREVIERNGLRVEIGATDRELAGLERQAAAERMLAPRPPAPESKPFEVLQAQQRAAEAGAQRSSALKALEQAARADERMLREAKPDSAERRFAEVARQERLDETAHKQQAAWRQDVKAHAPKPQTPKPQGGAGLKVIDSATGAVSGLADFLLDFFGGTAAASPEKKPMDQQASPTDPEARREQQLARLASIREAERDAKAVDNIRRDMEAGRGLKAEDVRNLTHTHQEQIRLFGDVGVQQMVEDARKAETLWKGNERERER